MCGIAGVLDLTGNPTSETIVRNMARAIAHRGPDGEGIYVAGPIGLGHRRLAIIDPTPAGHQPMVTKDGRYYLIYNGEIYNFSALRIELESLGHTFHSQTDTEVVLQAFAQWGAACVDRFNGMFALAIWDQREKSLFLARDRYGIKPLYYTVNKGKLLFGSEIKAIRAHPDTPSGMNQQGLVEYFTFQNFFAEQTLFKDIQLLPPGSHMTVNLDNPEKIITTRYWDYCFQEPQSRLSEAEYLEQFDFLFQQAVNRQLVADVDVGAYLSGGVDSGSITAIAAKQLKQMRTFTCGFDLHSASGIELGFDERATAEHMSYLFQTEQYEVVLKAGDMERCLEDLVWHLEEPRVGQSYPNYYVSRLASKFNKVVLGGTGGDELFGGYPWRYYRAVVNQDFDHYVAKYYEFWQRMVSSDQMSTFYSPIWNQVKHYNPQNTFKDIFQEHFKDLRKPEDYVNHSLYLEAKTFLHGLLTVEDKLSMAHGLEMRVPFMDNDLVDFAMQVPVSMKLGNLQQVVRLNENDPGNKIQRNFQKTKDGKLLLRKAMQRYVPEEVAQAVKKGFSAPDASWFQGESIEYVKQSLMTGKSPIFDYLDRTMVEAKVMEHLDGKRNNRLLVWSLIYVDLWLKRFT
ncbi:asparagine synthase (glutamine-hydrolyzing) [Magnetococcus sp. PR-3]|uniref:asparagine synthase (glutamine-hydrolyzing) n=1 Tax=Magnetococcus sp. PR-3 TaxID=3120355 RepID=UPI002FCE378D